ncbi:uncharacterized protein GIQ15_02114 [Arthroderma uncinatum]|uniref:uncharacterized protein n=1 Tax=Arthroderma uncinatum TaxID=74035 RepID=UPI00144AB30D|nr:uncharacterized protein GIQ15_02114 [Arthroderma uncinatum]KAF3482790.1 hypothetical protein GIQ15_02114 [Arthroderma uncinatum]
MFRSASRSLLRGTPATQQLRFAQSRRWISDAPSPVQKKQGWRSTVVRWGLAAGAVYYYNTSPIFAEEPPLVNNAGYSSKSQDAAASPTIESLAAAKKPKAQPTPQPSKPKQSPSDEPSIAASAETGAPAVGSEQPPVSAGDLEKEAGQEGAFNPETGEINWDCPCLGGMAHGPCGEEFRAAFSCFVFSEEEPKGMDCIEKFKFVSLSRLSPYSSYKVEGSTGMQDCFRQHPEIYGNELDDEEVDAQLEEHIASEREAEQKSSVEGLDAVPAATKEQAEAEPAKDKLHEAISKELNSIESTVSKN